MKPDILLQEAKRFFDLAERDTKAFMLNKQLKNI